MQNKSVALAVPITLKKTQFCLLSNWTWTSYELCQGHSAQKESPSRWCFLMASALEGTWQSWTGLTRHVGGGGELRRVPCVGGGRTALSGKHWVLFALALFRASENFLKYVFFLKQIRVCVFRLILHPLSCSKRLKNSRNKTQFTEWMIIGHTCLPTARSNVYNLE